MAPAELEERHGELPRDRDVVLYCTCPNQATSARAAMRLHRRGFKHVRPLLGGFQTWIDLDFPTVAHVTDLSEAVE
jgi:rhodanese-related sulfurtransferase